MKLSIFSKSIRSIAVCGLALAGSLRAQDHGHLSAGAVSQASGAQAIWENGADFIASSGYVKTLDYTNSGRFAGYYQNNITLTALPATSAYGGPTAGAGSLGALFQARVSVLSGPPGGQFGFWETNSDAMTGPYVLVGVGETASKMFRLTQTDGSPTADPYGHIHGRRLSVTRPGIYKVGFQAVDVSTNGPGGGPIHPPTAVLPVWFQAGVNLESVEPDYQDGHVHIRFAAPLNTTWQLEYTEALPTLNWLPTGDPVAGQDYFVEKMHEGDPGATRFYRLRRLAP